MLALRLIARRCFILSSIAVYTRFQCPIVHVTKMLPRRRLFVERDIDLTLVDGEHACYSASPDPCWDCIRSALRLNNLLMAHPFFLVSFSYVRYLLLFSSI